MNVEEWQKKVSPAFRCITSPLFWSVIFLLQMMIGHLILCDDEANVGLVSKKGWVGQKDRGRAHRDPNGAAHNPTNLSKNYTI